MNVIRIVALLLLGFQSISMVQAQATFRPERGTLPAPQPPKRVLPCNGDLIFEENFDAGIPGTWTVLDIDDHTPKAVLNLGKGWQSHVDYKDANNQLAVTPSWYEPAGQSDDWLITPAITLGTNTCLSWVSYSQDKYFPETFEVRISTTTPDTAGFFAEAVVDSIGAEDDDYEYRAVDLSDWAGQTVYIAFRQTSNDRFVLALDEVKLANVGTVDAGISAWQNTESGNLADTIVIAGEIANYGTDTLTSVTVNFSVDGGTVQSMSFDSIKVIPFQTLNFTHDSLVFTDSTDQYYDICVWTSNPNGGTDSRVSNDTLCDKVAVGNPIAIDNQLVSIGLKVFPNPSNGQIRVEWTNRNGGEVELGIWDLNGKMQGSKTERNGTNSMNWDLSELSKGLYLLRVRTGDGASGYKNIIIE